MGALLRTGGFLLILGTLILMVGGYASLTRASMVAVRDGFAQSNPGWIDNAHWIGIALMMIGLLAAFTAFFLLIKNMLRQRIYVSYRDDGDKLTLSPPPVRSDETKQEKR